MRHSDIFDSYAKIAMEKGIVSKASTEEIKKKLEENPRMDSLDADAIKGLYGVKPDSPKDMEYKRNIIELAHPKSVIVSPAHDKLNGLVENVNERQDIILNILNKKINGQLTQHKYAKQDLVLSLVKVGNYLDSTDKESLRILADACLQQLAEDQKKKINKVAAVPVIPIAIAVSAAAILGAMYMHQHMSFVDQGFKANHETLISEIDDILNGKNEWGFGYVYKEPFLKTVSDLKSELVSFYNEYEKAENVFDSLETIRTAKQLQQIANSPKGTEVIDTYNKLIEIANNQLPMLIKVLRNFKNETYKLRNIKEKGMFIRMLDKAQILHGGHGLVSDDFDDVVNAINPYMDSIKKMLEQLHEAKTFQDNAANDMRNVKSYQAMSEEDKKQPTPPTATPIITQSPAAPSAASTKPANSDEEEILQDALNLFK
jgi:hypothetical protein